MPNSLEKSTPLFSADWRARFRRQLRRWYRQAARDLPWRKSRDPYRVWVSEIMLQQTQVATVEAYFKRFVEAFPTIADLAAADEQQVLRLWEGLGYYRRARQLHACARTIVEQHRGVFPSDPAAVRALPGIGRYTAGAILSIAFGVRAPILEANTVRLFCRLLAYREDPAKAAGQQVLWGAAEELLPQKDIGEFNQALMELGSLVCTPREPKCGECPAQSLCPTHSQRLVAEIPVAKTKTKYEEVDEAAVIVRRGNKILLVQREAGERWAGLWDFPRFALQPGKNGRLAKQLIDGVRRQTGVEIEPAHPLATIKHGVTRFRITLHCHAAHYVGQRPRRGQTQPQLQWLRVEQLADVPLSTTGRKISELIGSRF